MEQKESAIYAHSIYQYKKWKNYARNGGDVSDMFIISQTYVGEINTLIRSKGLIIDELPDDMVFTIFGKAIMPPKGYFVCNGCGMIERLRLMVSYPYGEYYCHTCDEEFNGENFDWQQDC